MTSNVIGGHFLIDQQTEVSKSYLTPMITLNNSVQIHELSSLIKSKNPLLNNAKNQGSYQIILEQSLTTQDKSFLYEILIENDPLIIRSSLQNLSPKRVIELLKMIKSLLEQHIKLGKGQDDCLSIGMWLEQLIRLHLTTIVSNIQNKETIISIRKFLQRKTQRKEQIVNIKSHLLSQETAQELQCLNQVGNQKKNPKFQYLEEQKYMVEDSEKGQKSQVSQINDEDMEGLDMDELGMDDFLEEDF